MNPPGIPPRKPRPTSGLFAFLSEKGRKSQAAPPQASGRAALAHVTKAPSLKGLDWSGLTKAQADGLKRAFDKIRKIDPYFDVVYRSLEQTNRVYKLVIDPKIRTYGQFLHDPQAERGGSIGFPNVEGASNLETTNEEFFHAYQNLIYGRSRMSRIGGSNIELEPKFLDGYKKLYGDDSNGWAQMPGEERMYSLLYGLDKKTTVLTPKQQAEYLEAVEAFRLHWEKENRKSGVSNIYDDPKTQDGPAAALDIINKVRNVKKK